jgi:hypothetical protein
MRLIGHCAAELFFSWQLAGALSHEGFRKLTYLSRSSPNLRSRGADRRFSVV